MSIYIISNSEGRQGDAWTQEYVTLDDAMVAAAEAMGWATLVRSPCFIEEYGGQEVSAWAVYETQEACDQDEEGAYAPRIRKVASISRCNKTTHGGYLCDDEPGHGGTRCWSKLFRK